MNNEGHTILESSISFDYIVVGGGTTGSIVASKLSKEHSVLLLERGNNVSWCNPLISNPKNWAAVKSVESLEWGYESVPQKHMNNRVIPVARAKALGGCQIHNAMVYVRGGKEGFDEWTAEGCDGWDYDSIVPYFEEAENKLNILHAEKNDFFESMVAACKENHIPYNEDYNLSGEEFGISPFQFLIDNKMQRETTYRSYIQHADLTNLMVRSDVLVSRLLFNESKKCIGVEFYDMLLEFNVVYRLKVKKGVILSAGAIGTPQILLLSGIGPRQHLEEHRIEVISDLQGVGQNLQDDLFVSVGFKSKKIVDPQPYGLLGAVIFWPSRLCKTLKQDVPTDIEASLGSGAMVGMESAPDKSYWIWPNIQKLGSRGTLKLRSNSIFDNPLIDPNYYADPNDLLRSIQALKLAIQIGSASAMADWCESQLEPPPSASTDEELKEHILKNAGTCDHFSGTAKMGSITDCMAVVSPKTLEVYGVTGLRVADASIIPSTVSGNTQGAAMMIGEKASAIILSA